MLNFKTRKKLMIPVIALILVVAIAGNVYAYTGYLDPYWCDCCGVNKMSSYDHNQTRLIQTHMKEYGSYNGTINGRFYQSTHDAVYDYQDMNIQLSNDGIVGHDTWYWMQLDIRSDNYEYTSSYSNRDYYQYAWATNLTPSYKYRHYDDGYWYVLVNGSWYHVN